MRHLDIGGVRLIGLPNINTTICTTLCVLCVLYVDGRSCFVYVLMKFLVVVWFLQGMESVNFQLDINRKKGCERKGKKEKKMVKNNNGVGCQFLVVIS